MTNFGLILCVVLITLVMIVISAYFAYKTVFSSKTVCIQNKKVASEGDVSIDDICEKYLKLTNLD